MSLKKETRDAMLQSALEDKEEAERENKEASLEIKRCEEKMKQVKTATAEDKENHEKIMDFMMDKYNNLLVQVQRYHNEMATVMEEE